MMKRFALLVGILLFSVLVALPGSKKVYVVKEECICAETIENYEKMSEYSVTKDKAALIKMMENYEIFILKQGVRVELLEEEGGKSKVKIQNGQLSGKVVYVNTVYIE